MENIGEIASNFDRIIDEELVEKLKQNPLTMCASYPGWNFYGEIHYDGENFLCRVMVYGRDAGVYRQPSVDQLMEEVSDEWGYD